jgi:hypothetical protein
LPTDKFFFVYLRVRSAAEQHMPCQLHSSSQHLQESFLAFTQADLPSVTWVVNLP